MCVFAVLVLTALCRALFSVGLSCEQRATLAGSPSRKILGEMAPKRKLNSLLVDESALLKLGTIIAFWGVGTNQAPPTRQPFVYL